MGTLRPALGLVALSHVLGCFAFTEPRAHTPADDRGTQVASAIAVTALTWSTDGTELFFVDELSNVRAVPAAGGTARTVYSPSVSIAHMRVVANKVYLAVPANGTAAWQISRIDPATGNATTVATYAGPVSSTVFAVSNDERFVAFFDSLYDVVAGTQRGIPIGRPWSFSPDGSQLLFEPTQSPTTTGFRLIATNDLSVLTLAAPTDIVGRTATSIGAHYWEGNDPKLLRVVENSPKTEVKAFVLDGRTGAARQVAFIGGNSSAWTRRAAISPDGSRVGIWVGPFEWAQLHVVDTETLLVALAATVSGALPEIETVVLSPDASRAAYVLYVEGSVGSPSSFKLYVTALP